MNKINDVDFVTITKEGDKYRVYVHLNDIYKNDIILWADSISGINFSLLEFNEQAQNEE